MATPLTYEEWQEMQSIRASKPRRKSTRRKLRRHGFVESWPASYVYVEDHMAGRRHVYTLWCLPMAGDERRARVIGRELPIRDVRRVIKRDQESIRS